MQLPFIGGAYRGRSNDINSQTCINLYPIIDREGGKSVFALTGTPGHKSFCTSGHTAEVRGLHVVGTTLYAVVGNRLYSIDTAGAATQITGTFAVSTGKVWMADNGTELVIVDPGDDGYLHTMSGSTFAAIADADFPTPDSLCFMDGYFIVTKTGTGEFYISSAYDGTAWDATDLATAEQYTDDLVACMPNRGQLVLMGKLSTEFWFNTGAAAFPFEHIGGTTIKEGTEARGSLATDGQNLYWLNNFNQVRMLQGYQSQTISTPTIDYIIDSYTTISDAIGYCYTQEGHSFYVLTFPTEATLVYDVATGFWHERQSYKVSVPGGSEVQTYESRHRGNCYAFFNNKHYIGDFEDGNIYEYDLDTYLDNSITIRRERAGPVIHSDRKWMFFPSFEIDFESGVGLVTGQGNDPQVCLDWSDDGGHTWGHEHWAGIGKIGKYEARAKWNRLGRSRNRVLRVHISDPVKVVMIDAHAEIIQGVM